VGVEMRIEEIQDILAEFENRVSYLENSEHSHEAIVDKPKEPRPVVNVTYQINARSTPAFKELDEKIHLLNGRLSKYFEEKEVNKQYDPF